MINQEHAYQEIYDILKNMDKQKVMKIPNEILEFIIKNRNTNYQSKVDKNDLLNPENIDERTCNIITWLNLNFWCNRKEKETINSILNQNEIKQNKAKSEKFSNEIFGENKDKITENIDNKNHYIIKKKENIFYKIISFIKRYFNKT